MTSQTPVAKREAVDASIADHTDQYFNKTKRVIGQFGDKTVTYAVFMRRPVIFCPQIMLDWLDNIAKMRNHSFKIEPCFEEGDWVGAGEPLVYITGSFHDLVDLETLYLQKLGSACVAAYNAFTMCSHLPEVKFLAMDARHCAGSEMADMMAYAASVGSRAAQKEFDAVGFIGNANNATAHYFGNDKGLGTMPHALIGYAGSTTRAAEMFHESFPDDPLTVLVDYYGKEVTDALATCKRFPELAAKGKMSVRMDTHGGRFIEGLDPATSYAVLERYMPRGIRQYRSEQELKWLVGTGVSAAAIYSMREKLDDAGFEKVKIVASSGFSVEKCRIMGNMKAPIDVVGTGSFLPEIWPETYATADIIAYDGVPGVKVGREFLLKKEKR
ncbi:hypothetical protein [Sneathiella sp. HT1-7]|jgi:nicotinate phosphoribosyltransferase|uniref:hypothetical protein n=1 Tax=Sneathiella sp. HT1-7 TaxID=2887192 RepID=UPI001D141F33|nr:hypothetical protein [Sneathiella sp. HT1-7]